MFDFTLDCIPVCHGQTLVFAIYLFNLVIYAMFLLCPFTLVCGPIKFICINRSSCSLSPGGTFRSGQMSSQYAMTGQTSPSVYCGQSRHGSFSSMTGQSQ